MKPNRFEELADRTRIKIHRFAYQLAGNREDAEDLTQEAFMRAYRSFETFNGERSFENWVLRIVQNLFLDLVRSRKRRVKPMSYDALEDQSAWYDAPDKGPTPDQLVLARVQDPLLAKTVERLAPIHREMLVMAHIEDLSYAEIAERLGLGIPTVRTRVHRAHKAMRQVYAQVEREVKLKSPSGPAAFA
jgi:RNA polymerase sigma-70 factor (ECF subfamily)